MQLELIDDGLTPSSTSIATISSAAARCTYGAAAQSPRQPDLIVGAGDADTEGVVGDPPRRDR